MIGSTLQRIPVVLLLLIFPHPLKKLTTTADPLNLTQCVLQTNDRGLNVGCSVDFMVWVRLGYYGRTPSASPSQFCENPTSSTNDCIPDKSGDRRNMGAECNTYSNCQPHAKNYNDIVASCPSNNGGFPYGYVSYECLPRKQIDGSYINSFNSYDSTVNSALYGKIYLLTSGYPYLPTNKNVQFQISVDVNTRVSIRLLDAYGRLLDATGPCAYTLYIYSAATSTYREWCVNKTSWTIDDSTPFVCPATSQGSQNIDVVFTKADPSLDAEGAFWMLIEAVNVVDSSPGRNINVSSGTTFTPQVRPTTMTSTTTTTTPTTTTPTTTKPTTTTPTTTTSTTTTPSTTTPTTTTPTTTTSTTTTPTTTTPTTTTPTTTTPTTTTPTTTTPTTTTPTTTTTAMSTQTTPTTTITPTTTTTTTTPRTTPTTTTPTTTTPTTTTTTTTPPPSLATATSSTVTSSAVTHESTSNEATASIVYPSTTNSSGPMSTSGADVNNTADAARSSLNTNIIIGVVVAAACVIVIVVIVVVAAVICRRNPDRKPKPRPPLMVSTDPIIASHNRHDDDDDASKFSSTRREHIYDEIHDPSSAVAMATVSYPPQHHHPASPTILRIGRGQSRKAANGVKVRFTTPGGDEDLVFYPGVASNVSDDDKANRQTAQNANEVHPRLISDFSSSKRLSFGSRQDSVPSSTAGDPDTGVQLNPVYGFRPADIYMY